MTDLDLANLQYAVYHPKQATVRLDWIGEEFGIFFGLHRDGDGVMNVVFRGSDTFIDWVKDAEALASPVTHFSLGPVHPGFLEGMEDFWQSLKKYNKPPFRLCGHSLGAGRARILTGLMVEDNLPPVSCVCWGEPKSGFQQLADLTAKIPGNSYQNTNGTKRDPIYDIPVNILFEKYVHDRSVVPVSRPASTDDWHGIPHNSSLALHNFILYQEAMASIKGV